MTKAEVAITCVLQLYDAENVEAISAIKSICEELEDKLERKLAEGK